MTKIEQMKFAIYKEFPNYIVYENGLIFNKKLKIYIAQFENANGYLECCLKNDKIGKKLMVHRVVVYAFIGNAPSPKHQVAHLDGNKKNNHVTNLVWATAKENISHKKIHGTYKIGGSHNRAKLNDDQRAALIKEYKRYSYGKSNSIALSKKYGIAKNTVNYIIRNQKYAEAYNSQQTLDSVRKKME